MKLTALVDAMTTSTVKSTSTGVGRIGRAEDRQREQLHAVVGHDARGEHLPGQLGQPVELADVVDGPDAGRRSPAPATTPKICLVEKSVPEVRQRPRHERRPRRTRGRSPTPPSRGIGVVWTSRSRTGVKAPVATARRARRAWRGT